MDQRLIDIAVRERDAARDTVERLLPASARVSVYLFQPVAAPGLRATSPGSLWDVGPLPDSVAATPRDQLYQCAEAGRTGSFLQSAEECTRRVPQTTRIDAAAFKSYRAFNALDDNRRAQIAVEQARHGFRARKADGPPEGSFIHHLALSPSVQDFTALASSRFPVLGTIFVVTDDEAPRNLHEYSNLVDYAVFLAGELLDVRAEHLLGRGHVTSQFEGSALEALLDAPTSDAAVQLVIKLLFAHHWFFPYDAVAHALFRSTLAGNDDATTALYERHGWSPPRTHSSAPRDVATLHATVITDLSTLVNHICWYRLGREFRPRPGALRDAIRTAVNTALLLLCGDRREVPQFASQRSTGSSLYFGPPAALHYHHHDALLAPVFAAAGVRQLVRDQGAGSAARLTRFASSVAVCGPGDTGGVTRTHLKPSRFVEGFGQGGIPRFSTRKHDGMRDQTRWLCSYAIGRLAEQACRDREENRP